MKLIQVVFLLLFTITTLQGTASPIETVGTVLPEFKSNTPARIFNDLMKQSIGLVPWTIFSWGGSGRCWSCQLTQIGGLAHQYPSQLAQNMWAVAEIPFFKGIDENLQNAVFTLKYSGKGTVGVYQQGFFNTTWTSGSGGNFTLKTINSSLLVFIYLTDPTDPVTGITILPVSLGQNVPTFTTNFLNYLKPFNLFRTCKWQGQRIYSSGTSLQIWANRTLVSSSSQVVAGVALEHILEIEQVTGGTIWPCIPDSADTNYITEFARLIGNSRDKSKMMYLQFGNVYTIMNDFPDKKSTPAFDTFMQTYGPGYRSSVLFTINYQYVQYYINVMGSKRNPPVNFTYIDAIGFEDINFGLLHMNEAYDLNDDDLKELVMHYTVQNETKINQAYQLAKRNGTELIMISGGPYIKTKRFDYIWKSKSNSSYLPQAAKELELANRLDAFNLNNQWVGEYYLFWIQRLKSMGVKTIVLGELMSGAFTYDTDVRGIVPYLNTTTPLFRALTDLKLNGRKTILPTSGTVPANPSTCNPQCVWGDCILNTCACFAGYSGSDCSVYTAPNQQNKIGVNLQGLSYWTTQTPFVDLHREGSDWVFFVVNQGWSSGDAFKSQVTFDPNGYPTYLPPGITVGTLMARDILTHYDAGKYTILYDGDGVLTFGMYDVVRVKYGIGKCIVDVLPSTNGNNGLLVTIERTNPDNHIRNIRVIRPGFENTWWNQVYSPLLLEKLAPYGTLRFMEWTNTNGQTDKVWFDRVKVTHRTYTKNGVAWQDLIHLANVLGKNVWINIPHLADDDYITQLANLFLHTLEPHLHVYVQYSNEVWGTLFPGGQYAQQEGVKYYSDPSKITPLNNATNPTQARFCYLSMITQKISDIWKDVWNHSSRLQIVVSTQAVNADTTRRILVCENGYQKVDAVAIAPYLSVTLNDTMSQMDVLNKMHDQLPILGAKIREHLTFTSQYNLPLTCYEAGQGLLGTTTITNQLQIGVQTDDSMKDIYTSYFATLFQNSIQLANHYSDTSKFSKYGSWGMYQYADEKLDASSKWKGTVEYLSQQNLPVSSLTFGACDKNCSGNGFCNFGRCVCYNGFYGDNCSLSKYIDYVECGYLCTFNQGVCEFKEIIGVNRYFQCNCYPGYIGAYCAIAQCSGQCSYNGECTAPNTCKCFRGKMGSKCEVDCGCQGHGTCNTDGTCLCDQGFTFNSTSKKCEFSCLGNPSSQCNAPNSLTCSSGCAKGTCKNCTCECWPGFSGAACDVEVDVSYKNAFLGVNVGGLAYWSTQHMFKDYNKQSSDWVPLYYPSYFNSSIQYTWDTKAYFPTQINGNPASLYTNQSVGKLLLRDLQLRYPQIDTTNEYVLLYDGDGVLKLTMDSTPYQVSAGRIRFTVKPSTVRDNGVFINLIKTNPSNPVRNIRVILAKDEYNYQKDLLTPDFLTFINEFSTIRFMELSRTNGNPVSEWNQTTTYDFHSQAVASGISIQLLTEIISRTGKNAWINVPHKASDDYVRKFATYLRDNIPQKRTIYVEYSNEVWNTFFDQGKYAVTQATALGLTNYHKFYAKRSKEIFNIFKDVFGSSSSSRLKFVISYQAVSQWVANQIFDGTGLAGLVDIVASGAYYDCDSIGNTTNTAYYATQTPADILQKCSNSFGTLDSMFSIQSNISSTYNVKKATYESGTSISESNTIYNGGDNPAATTNFIAANRDPGMYNIYKTLLNKYKSGNLGVEAPLMLYSSVGLPSKYGSWGLLDYMDQVRQTPTHPKFQAIKDFNNNN